MFRPFSIALACLIVLAVPAYAAEPKAEPVRLDPAQLDGVTAGIFRLPRVDSIIRLPRLPRALVRFRPWAPFSFNRLAAPQTFRADS